MLYVLFALLAPALTLADPDPTLAPMAGLIERYRADLGSVSRFHDTPMSIQDLERAEAFNQGWLDRLDGVDFKTLDVDNRADYLLLREHLRFEVDQAEYELAQLAEIEPLAPFTKPLVAMLSAHRRMEPIEPREAAETLSNLAPRIAEATEALTRAETERDRVLARRAAIKLDRLAWSLRRWYNFYRGYDPMFSWWCEKPYDACATALRKHSEKLRETVAGITASEDPVIGDPVGRDVLLRMLQHEMIAYSPEELIEIAEREYAWCLEQMLQASREIGFGDDWKAALEHVRDQHVEPGEQPAMIAEMAHEAVKFLEDHDLITVPELAKRTWRMSMMSPERQKVSPYFLGGETIIVSYPTAGMEHDDKLASMRGNNRHFSRAVVHHELIPGHHLQRFMLDRYRTHRNLFYTPFWIEGWALYWEMHLWDLGFANGPEDRIGMLFWRMHRCARIIFSLRFHLGEITAAEAVDYLVENVGHMRRNATAEVRRSVNGDYPPLYQAAYMLGGLQIRAMREEMVVNGDMTERQFHDAILRHGCIPIEMLRLILRGEPIARDFTPAWRFAGELPGS
ncbi:MAG: DUF885 domain-containing protein [Phycisphaerales bacterium]|nr:DUF885 domain-containing protein [Phycisphaerales bacterium]